MSTLANFNTWVNTRVPAIASVISSTEIDDAVLQAVDVWSKYRPQALVATIDGTGVYDYDLPASFVLGFSQIISLEYPVGERLPTLIDPADFTVYRSATSTAKIRLYRHTPAATEDMRVIYTAQHVVNGSGSTILDADEQAVADLGASIVCEWLSAFYSQATDSSLVVDSRDYKSQGTEYALRARRFRELAYAHLGIGMESASGSGQAPVPAAGMWKDFDSTRLDGSIRLTHPQT